MSYQYKTGLSTFDIQVVFFFFPVIFQLLLKEGSSGDLNKVSIIFFSKLDPFIYV